MGIAAETASRRAALIEKALNPHHLAYIGGMMESGKETGDPILPHYPGRDRTTETGAYTACDDIRHTAGRARLFTASTDLMELAVRMSASLPPQSILPIDLPADDGYLHLPVPLIVKDVRGIDQFINSVLWSRRRAANGHKKEGLSIWMFTSLSNEDDRIGVGLPDEWRLGLPDDSFYAWQFWAFGDEQWTYRDAEQGERGGFDLWVEHRDEEVSVPNGDGSFTLTANGGTVIGSPDPLASFLQTYWHLCQSPLTDLENGQPSRQVMKSLKRRGLPTGPCTVVVLRKRPPSKNKGDQGVWSLSYRYYVDAYWRRQWYGSGAARYCRQILVSGSVRGPDDAPWRDVPVVNVLAR